jgi:hypothetical protein
MVPSSKKYIRYDKERERERKKENEKNIRYTMTGVLSAESRKMGEIHTVMKHRCSS